MNKPSVILDTYVLAQGIRTGVYRVCDEVFPRLIASDHLDASIYVRWKRKKKTKAYLEHRKIREVKRVSSVRDAAAKNAVFLSPFGVAPPKWLAKRDVAHAHIIYDLIAIHHPEYFKKATVEEVAAIIRSLDEDTFIFVISEFTKRDLLNYRPDLSARQIVVVPLAANANFWPCVDTKRLDGVRSKYAIPENVPYILSLATLEVRKNLDGVISSFIQYLEKEPDSPLHLVLSGQQGWKRDKLNDALSSAGKWRDRIILTGFVDEEDLSPLYSGAEVFVFLSRYEGFGLPVLEAMACGTPVISADNSSLPEVVGNAGILVPASDNDAVVKAMSDLLSDAKLRHNLSKAGLERSRQFSWDACTKLVEEGLELASLRHQHRMRKRRRRPKEPGAITNALRRDDGRLAANFQHFQNGSIAPAFPATHREVDVSGQRSWPNWSDTLTDTGEERQAEGGLRLSGSHKSDTDQQPLVSYVTVVRNNAEGLQRAIDSVQAQSYRNVEHIILDGASTDGTIDVMQKNAGVIDYFCSEPDSGLYAAMNKAIPLARGNLICALNSDDWLEPDAADIAVERMRHIDGPSMLLSAARVPERETEWYPAFVHPGCYFKIANDCHNAMYANRAAYEGSGPYDTSLRIAADFKWIMACLDAGAKFVYTRERTINYSLGGISSDVQKHREECIRVVMDRFPELTEDEARGLHELFFAFGAMSNRFATQAESTQFLRELIAARGGNPDLFQALSWAAIERMDFHWDHLTVAAKWKRTRRRLKARLKTAFKR